MNDYGFWSLFPPIIAIGLALWTRQVFLSLIAGIWIGWVIINEGHIIYGTFDTINAFVKVFEDAGNTRTVIFTLLVGALIALIQRSGGVEGFILHVKGYLSKIEQKHKEKGSKKVVQLMAALTGLVIFVESNISILTVGTLFRPIFDNLKIPREKLAYLADSSSAPSCILFPFNAWGAYIMGLLMLQGFDQPFSVLYQTIPFNFYPLLALAIVFYIVFSGKDFGPMKAAEKRASEEGKVLGDNATPMVSEEISMLEAKEGITYKATNMVVPILVMVFCMPMMLIYTGWNGVENQEGMSLFSKVTAAIGQGSGSTSVLYAVIAAILVGFTMYKIQGFMRIREMMDLSLKGMSGMVSLALLMVLAFAIGSLCKELGTGQYIADVTRDWLSPGLVPAIVFMVSCFIAFSTGTSWGTFAIMISIAVPMAQALDTNVTLAIAAALGGGVFGDHCSPISDTTIISSMASASDHIDHVRTQLPYALIAGTASIILYIIAGFTI